MCSIYRRRVGHFQKWPHIAARIPAQRVIADNHLGRVDAEQACELSRQFDPYRVTGGVVKPIGERRVSGGLRRRNPCARGDAQWHSPISSWPVCPQAGRASGSTLALAVSREVMVHLPARAGRGLATFPPSSTPPRAS